MDRVCLVVEHRSRAEVGLRHPEGPLDDLVPGEPDLGDVRDVPFQARELPCPVDEDLVDRGAGAGELHEPVLLERPLPVGDALRAFDLLVEGVVVAPVAFRGVVVDHPPLLAFSPTPMTRFDSIVLPS